ncbi:MAG: hypothetical protein ACPLQO_00495 [Desulfotomaculales bacterium]
MLHQLRCGSKLDEAIFQKLYRWLAEIAPAWIKKLGFAEAGVNCPPPAPV